MYRLNLKILTPNFFLGSATNNISSSNDDLSITTKNLTASGSNVEILTPSFFLGSATNNISSSNDDLSITTKNLTASGSNIEILTPKFFFGDKSTSFISSSTSQIEISASAFHLQNNGQLTGSNVLFDGGTIGGFTLSNQRLTGTKGLIIDSLSGSIFLSSNTSTDGTTIDGAEGIFGHGDDSSKRYTSHAGQFRFTEDSISPPPNSDGIVYSEAEPDSVDSYNGNFNQPIQGGGTT